MEKKRENLDEKNLFSIENNPLALALIKVDKTDIELIDSSEAFNEIFPILRDKPLTRLKEAVHGVVHPDDLPTVQHDYQLAILALDHYFHSLFRLLIKGEYRWFSSYGKVLVNKDGTAYAFLAVFDVDGEANVKKEKEQAAERQAALFEKILSTTKTSIFWKDSNRKFLGANQAFLDYYGFPDESSIIGKKDEEMGWHNDPEPYKNDEVRVLKEGISTFRVKGKCIAKGEEKDIVASKSPIIVNGKIVGLVGSFEDVTTETRQAKEIADLNDKLSKNIEEQNQLMKISGICLARISLNNFSLIECSDTVFSMVGYSRNEAKAIFHNSLKEYLAGDYRKEFETFSSKINEALQRGEKSMTMIIKLPSKTGFLWVSGAVTFIDFDAKTNKPANIFVVYRDVGDVVRMQEKLNSIQAEAQRAAFLAIQNTQMSQMIDGVPSGLGALKINKGVPEKEIKLNNFFFSKVDLSDEGNGKVSLSHFSECLHPDDRDLFKDSYHEFLSDKKPLTRQFRFRKKGSVDYFWANVRCSISQFSTDVEIAYFVFTDIQELKEAEKGLRESQYFYRQAVDAAGLKTWTYDIVEHTVRMTENKAAFKDDKILGLQPIINHVPESIISIIDEADREKFLSMYQKVDHGENAACEVWFATREGLEPRCERITYFFPEGRDKKIAIGLGRNITAEKKVQERYQREINYLKATDDSNLLAKGHFNLTKDAVVEYSSKVELSFPIQNGDSYSSAISSFISLTYVESERKEYADCLDREKLLKRYQAGEMSGNLIFRRRVERSLPIWISLSYHTYMSPETGDVELFTYTYDVTEKMENDEIMRKISGNDFDYIGLIFLQNNQFEFVQKNPKILFPGLREMTDYSLCCEYVRSNFINPNEKKQFDDVTDLANIIRGLKNEGHFVATYMRTEAGKILCKKLDYVWLDEDSKVILVVRSDVTSLYQKDQEQVEKIEAAKMEAVKASEAKSVFLSSMSHDLRTPLNGVLGFTSLALKEEDPIKKQDYLEKIESSGRLLLDLINDTLELSRIESGKSIKEPEVCPANELVPPVVTSLRPAAELKNIRLEADFTYYPSYPLWVDRVKIQKIILNLLSNAIKYTPKGGLVSLRFEKCSSAGQKILAFSIKDSGIGMSEEFLKRMYEPFAQEKRSEAVNVPGTGLGLSIVKKFVDLLGGQITVTSQIHLGTEFHVSLPVEEAEQGMIKNKEEEKSTLTLAGKKILLCEDNPMNQEIAVMLLKEKGLLVDCASNGEEGVKRFIQSKEGNYDAILMDIRMPVMDGLEATKKIRSQKKPSGKNIPIIAMSADAFEESFIAAQKAGMDGYVTKPIIPEKLYETLTKFIK
jgi:PAS domain S-box-containing protein